MTGARAPRRWRGLDWGTVQVVLEAEAPRVNCPAHGPTVVAVPWARHHAGHTYAFDDAVAWLAVACSKTAVCELMRIAWGVGAIVARVWRDAEKSIDRFANLRRGRRGPIHLRQRLRASSARVTDLLA